MNDGLLVFGSELKSIAVRGFKRVVPVKRVHCLGDSHTWVFKSVKNRHTWWNTSFQLLPVNGATALGIVNPNSQTQAFQQFGDYLASLSPEDNLIFCLGEVDCGFVIWYRAEKYGVPVKDQFELSLNNYMKYVDEVHQHGFKRILLTSAPLPTIRDGQIMGEVANKRKEVKASLRSRTDLTLEYNQRLREYCKDRGHVFLDTEKDTLDPATRLISDRFRNADETDHHLDRAAVADLMIVKLRQAGYW